NEVERNVGVVAFGNDDAVVAGVDAVSRNKRAMAAVQQADAVVGQRDDVGQNAGVLAVFQADGVTADVVYQVGDDADIVAVLNINAMDEVGKGVADDECAVGSDKVDAMGGV